MKPPIDRQVPRFMICPGALVCFFEWILFVMENIDFLKNSAKPK